MKAWESGDLRTDGCDQVLRIWSAVGSFTIMDECGVRLG